MAAFKLAKQYGIPGIELDIHLTADGKVVVCHDASTKRTAPGTALDIARTAWAELRAIDVGSWKGTEFRGEGMPLLSDLLEQHGQDFYFDIEIKSRVSSNGILEASLARILDDFKMDAERVVVSSFNHIMLGTFKATCPRIPTAIIYCKSKELPWFLRHGEGRWIAKADFLKPKYDMPNQLAMTLGRIIGGRKVLPWTIDDSDIARRMLELGCEGIISNRPHKLGIGPGLIP
jgi:glycerophosphoryl diester phosphodiesterase